MVSERKTNLTGKPSQRRFTGGPIKTIERNTLQRHICDKNVKVSQRVKNRGLPLAQTRNSKIPWHGEVPVRLFQHAASRLFCLWKPSGSIAMNGTVADREKTEFVSTRFLVPDTNRLSC